MPVRALFATAVSGGGVDEATVIAGGGEVRHSDQPRKTRRRRWDSDQTLQHVTVITRRVSRRKETMQMPEFALSVGSMSCRHRVREVTAWLRDVPGVATVIADARTGTVVLGGTMQVADVLAAFAGSNYTPQLLDGPGG